MNEESPSWPKRSSPQQYDLASLVRTQLKRAPRASAVDAVGRACGLGPVESDEQPQTAASPRMLRQRVYATACSGERVHIQHATARVSSQTSNQQPATSTSNQYQQQYQQPVPATSTS